MTGEMKQSAIMGVRTLSMEMHQNVPVEPVTIIKAEIVKR